MLHTFFCQYHEKLLLSIGNEPFEPSSGYLSTNQTAATFPAAENPDWVDTRLINNGCVSERRLLGHMQASDCKALNLATQNIVKSMLGGEAQR